MLTRVGLSSLDGKRYPRELSGGQRQKAAIARALLLEPELLICDEAVSSLDAATRTQILDLLLRVVKRKKDRLVCFISHDMALIRGSVTGQAFSTRNTGGMRKNPGFMQGSVASVYESTSRFGNAADPLKARKQKSTCSA